MTTINYRDVVRACGRGALMTDLCCAFPSSCPGTAQTPDPIIGFPPADFTQWLNGIFPGTYTPDEQTWLLAADSAIEWASDWLAARTCLRIGICTTRLRACVPCGFCGVCSNCGVLVALDLTSIIGDDPITDATVEIHTDDDGVPDETILLGTTVDDLGVINGTTLVRHDETCWPTQRSGRPLGTTDTWQMVIDHGTPLSDLTTPDGRLIRGIPPEVRDAIADLACIRLVKCLPADRCSNDLPDHTQSVTANGQTVRLLTTLDFAKQGMIGIKSVDWVLNRYGCADPAGDRSDSVWTDPADSLGGRGSNPWFDVVDTTMN